MATMMVGAFARDENGEIKHKKPCQTEGCDWPNWHVCLVGKGDVDPEVLATYSRRRGGTKGMKFGPRSDEYRANISSAQRDRWDRQNGARDKAIAEYYRDHNVGHVGVAEHFGVSRSTALKALKRAEARGMIKMRKRGLTVRHDHN